MTVPCLSNSLLASSLSVDLPEKFFDRALFVQHPTEPSEGAEVRDPLSQRQSDKATETQSVDQLVFQLRVTELVEELQEKSPESSNARA